MAGAPPVSYERDELVWVSCPSRAWRPGKVLSSSDAELTVELVPGNGADAEEPDGDAGQAEVLSVPRDGSAAPAPWRSGGVRGPGGDQVRVLRRNAVLVGDGSLRFDDLTDVPELHEAAVLHALHARFSRGVIYTLSGPVLLAVNPFRTVPGLYGPEPLRRFASGEAPRPHIFGVAALALRGIRERCESQTVLISGESGAGKTETTKFVMQFLATAGAEAAAASGGSAAGGPGAPATPREPRATGRTSGAGMSRVERQVLGSNPLLEAFGNAKTLRNDNSSRFGKYIELQFGVEIPGLEVSPRLVGARIHTYLLEKVRVVHQAKGERSFHVFYQALAAANTPARLARLPAGGAAATAAAPAVPATPRQALGVVPGALGAAHAEEDGDLDLEGFTGHSAASFAYLRETVQAAPRGGCELEDFEATLAALRGIGVGSGEASDLFRALAAVLHLGNVRFRALNSEASEVADEEGPDGGAGPLAVTCGLLGLPAAELQEALCYRTMQAPGEARAIRMTTSAEKAAETRDALARHLYHMVFTHVVESTNHSVGFRDSATFCGVLDIFGFEFFEVNSFEQLCINYTNELLQAFFNGFIFQNEAALYAAEGVSWEPEDFPDNAGIVALLHERLTGVLPMLEEECFVSGGSSETWHRKLLRQHEGHANFAVVRTKQGAFLVRHFAGPVTYTADGFLEKNRDQLSPDLLACLKSSSRPFVRERSLEHDRVFGAGGRKSSTAGPDVSPVGRKSTTAGPDASPVGSPVQQGRGPKAASPVGSPVQTNRVLKAQRYTVSSEFRQQLQDLLGRIRATVPHFVRCIKPNPQNRPFADASAPKPCPLLDRPSVMEQLSYQGVLEAIRVARAGFPVRFAHADFCREFGCLAGGELRRELEAALRQDPLEGGADAQAVRSLLECGEVRALLAAPGAAGSHREPWCIGKTRVFLKQEPSSTLRAARLRRRHAAARVLQAAQRRRAARARFLRLRVGVLRLQALARGAAARGELWRRKRETAAVAIGAGLRSLLAQGRRRRAARAVLALQAWARMRHARRRFLATRSGLVRAQRWWRSLRKRRRWRRLREDVLMVQRAWRGSRGRRQAQERRVRVQGLRTALRHLVRRRRRNRAHRAWRAEVLGAYRGGAAPPLPPAPPKEAMVEELLGLQRELKRQEAEVVCLHAERAQLQSRLEALRARAYLRLRHFLLG